MKDREAYQPKKEKYHSLTQLVKELDEAGISPIVFNGHTVTTNTAKYTLYDSKVTIVAL